MYNTKVVSCPWPRLKPAARTAEELQSSTRQIFMTDTPGKSGIQPKSAYARLAIVAGAGLVLAIITLVPAPDAISTPSGPVALSPAGKACLGILVAAVILWLTEALDFAVTSLALLIIMPFFKVTDGIAVIKDGAAGVTQGFRDGFYELISLSFGNRLLFFFIGVFLLSAAFTRSGLGKRLMLWILKLSGGSPRLIILGMLIGGAFISMWVTNMGTAALLAPLAMEILRRSGQGPLKSNFGKSLMIACAWGPLFGGIATPAGCGPNPVAIAFLRDMAGFEISFLGWMSLGLPASMVMIPVGWVMLGWMFPPEDLGDAFNKDDFKTELEELGPPGRKEWWTLFVFACVILLWLTSGAIKSATDGAVDLPMEWVAMAGGLALMLPGVDVMTMKEAEESIPWNAVLLVMASMGLGLMMYETGAARWLAWVLLGEVGGIHPVGRIALVVTAMMFLKVFLASNTVTGIIAIPLLITLATDLGISPWMLVAPAAFTSSLGMVIITQSPTNVIPYSYGFFTVRDFLKSGVIMSVIVIVLLTLVISLVGPLTGMYEF